MKFKYFHFKSESLNFEAVQVLILSYGEHLQLFFFSKDKPQHSKAVTLLIAYQQNCIMRKGLKFEILRPNLIAYIPTQKNILNMYGVLESSVVGSKDINLKT